MEKMNDFDEYQEFCATTDIGDNIGKSQLKPEWMYYVLGIGGETGEMLEKIKKLFRDKKGLLDYERKKEIIIEMGDILWYMARLCDKFGLKFSYVPDLNIEKLSSRKKRNKLQGNGDER